MPGPPRCSGECESGAIPNLHSKELSANCRIALTFLVCALALRQEATKVDEFFKAELASHVAKVKDINQAYADVVERNVASYDNLRHARRQALCIRDLYAEKFSIHEDFGDSETMLIDILFGADKLLYAWGPLGVSWGLLGLHSEPFWSLLVPQEITSGGQKPAKNACFLRWSPLARASQGFLEHPKGSQRILKPVWASLKAFLGPFGPSSGLPWGPPNS